MHLDGSRFVRELCFQTKHAESAPIMRPLIYEVIGMNVLGPFQPGSNARAAVKHQFTLVGLSFCGNAHLEQHR